MTRSQNHRARRPWATALRFVVSLVAAGVAAGCEALAPTNWPTGGAPLRIPHARWILGDRQIEIAGDGKIYFDGEHELTVDRAGRVYDEYNAPVALLEPDGNVYGTDDQPLGFVGSEAASLPGQTTAWLSISPRGRVTRYDVDGERRPFGVWYGCGQSVYSQQTCLLVSHLVAWQQRERQRRRSGVSIGFGFGVGVPIR